MTFRRSLLTLAVGMLSVCSAAAQTASTAAPLRIVSAGPTGEVSTIEQANEIRVVFSEPMVNLGAVAQARPAFFQIVPDVAGTYRWSGTTELILTPARRLPLATKYDVRIDAGASAVSGHRLASAYSFSFTTPTARLMRTQYYRPGGRFDAQPIVVLHFNQPVKPESVVPHLIAAFQPHPFAAPLIPQAVQTRLASIDGSAMQALARKIQAVRAAASSSAPVSLTLARDWDKKEYPPSADMVVVQVTTAAPPESWVRITADGNVPSLGGPATSGRVQSYTVQLAPAFFVDAVECTAECDPDRRNPIHFRVAVKADAFAKALKASDVTDAANEHAMRKGQPRARESWEQDQSPRLTVEDAGFTAQPPASTWLVSLPADLTAADGQPLGYSWAGLIENWHQRAFTSFGDGHGVWETGGGDQLPFYARNFVNVKQWASAVEPRQLMSTLLTLQSSQFRTAPDSTPVERRLGGTPDRILSHGLDLSKVLKPTGTGLVWAAVEEGTPIPKSKAALTPDGGAFTRASLIQVTNLGISVKDSPQNTLIFVTRLDTGAPVAGARVSIIKPDGEAKWTGTTAADGVAIAPDTRLRNPRRWSEFSFLVMAERDGDVAYVGSDWNEGIIPWEFGVPLNLTEADPLLCGSVFTDRGVYKLGEEVHLKAILRSNTPNGVTLLGDGTAVDIRVRDGQDKVVDERVVRVGAWSTAEWTMTVPAEGSLGNYSIRAVLASDKAKADKGESPAHETDTDTDDRSYAVTGSFLVAAYRRPDFRVDVTLSPESTSPLAPGPTLAAPRPAPLAGDPLKGIVNGRYLFGAPMNKRPVHWTFTREPVYQAPAAITDRFPEDRWTFVGWIEDTARTANGQVAANDGELSSEGQLGLTLQTDAKAGIPYAYTLEGDVEDVSRQHIANRAALTVHPSPWYIGVKRFPLFNEQKDGVSTELVAVGLDGNPVAGIAIDVKLTQVQWTSVRRAEGNGFYTWETQRKEVPAGDWHLTSAADPVPLKAPLPAGGFYILEASAAGDQGRFAVTRESFYSLGAGYTAWQRYDGNRIDLVADKSTYKPGDTAKIMIESPWEQATALVTTEREGIRSHQQFALTSTQQSVDIPITDGDIPNLYVSILLVKGRTTAPAPAPRSSLPDPSDPGKPAFRLGYLQLNVEDASKRLSVAVAANKQEYRPANKASVIVDVKDRDGRGAPSEVTLWAVDYGVLSLTAYKTPDVLDSVYLKKALQVMTEDNRQRIISRRVLTPKGDSDGGGGGVDSEASSIRSDFRVLAFWLGSVTTDAKGHASIDVKLPESLTTYRIMAVAGDKGSRFGSGDSEIRINKPVTLKSTFPRFLAVGDKASFGAVVTSQLKTSGSATVSIESLDPQVLDFANRTPQTVPVAAGGSVEVRFDAAGRATGRARVRISVKLAGQSDAFQDVIPVEILVSPETVSAIGQAGGGDSSAAQKGSSTAAEKLTLPSGVVPTFGGLHVDLASTALVGLNEGAQYLIEYPYGCAEQRGSRALAMLLSADLGGAFKLPGVDPARLKPTVQSALRELEHFQCPTGGFAYWPGMCGSTSPYLTAYLLHVFKVAKDLNYTVDQTMMDRAYGYLEMQLAIKPPVNESWWPSYTAWQAFAVKVLADGGKNVDSHITRLYGYRERMPVFALAYLYDALVAKGEASGPRALDLRRRIGNAILPEAATAHVEELTDPNLMWYWNSNVRSTAIALNSLIKGSALQAPGPQPLPAGSQPLPGSSAPAPDSTSYRALAAWLLRARDKDGRWGNTQENAMALESLVAYYRRFEAVVPDFSASVRMGDTQIASASFKGRSTSSAATDVPMSKLRTSAAAGTEQPLTFTRSGSGTLFYAARLRYAVDELFQSGLDQGMQIERTYAPYVENGTRPATTTFKAGDLIRVTLTLNLTKERRFVAVTDPLPAGFEPVESWFATSAQSLARSQDEQGSEGPQEWFSFWEHGGFDHVERRDDRVLLFATRLSEGPHTFSYVVRATTAGTYRTAPAHAEEMYEPEVFGRTATVVIDVQK